MGLWNSVTDFLHNVTGVPTAAQKRDVMSQARGQMDAYKKQTELSNNELNRVRGEQDVEKRRIAEKTIRTLRRNFRPAGFLDSSNSGVSDAGTSSKLGG